MEGFGQTDRQEKIETRRAKLLEARAERGIQYGKKKRDPKKRAQGNPAKNVRRIIGTDSKGDPIVEDVEQVDKTDYFVEEIRANIIYQNKIAPLIGMLAG